MNNSKSIFVVAFVVFVATFILLTNYYNSSVIKADEYFSKLENPAHAIYIDNIETQVEYFKNQNQNNRPQQTTKPDSNKDLPNTVHPLDALVIPEFATGIEAYEFAEKVLALAKNFHIETSGSIVAAAGVTQKVKAFKIKDDSGISFGENLSHSMFVNTGLQVYYDNNQVSYRFANRVDKNLNANYDNKWSQTTTSNYINDFGILPNQLNHIVNKNTIINESNFKFDGKEYSFTLQLNPKTSTENYKRQVRKNANSKEYPEFKSVKLDVVITKDARFKSIKATEEYKIKAMGFNTTVNSTVTDIFKVIHGNVEKINIKP